MSVKLVDKPFVNGMTDDDSVFIVQSSALKQMSIGDFRKQLNGNDSQVLNELAFYIDVNKPSSKGEAKVDVGGNMRMRQLWEDAKVPILMNADGEYMLLNRNDYRFLEDGTQILVSDPVTGVMNWVAEHVTWASACDFMMILPKYYGRVQEITVNATTIQRCWFSLVPLPGGYEIPQQVVGIYKGSVLGGGLHSIPCEVPSGSNTIYQFWQKAQARSVNHGLANMDFRNYLMFHMMSKYGWRDSQNCKTNGDASLVWGVGLDGSESTLNTGQADKFAVQKNIKTGATASLGVNDGKAVVTDANGDTCHSVNVAGFENPWGQYFELVGGIASLTNDNSADPTDVYVWRSNFIPSSAPTAATFANVSHTKIKRMSATSSSVNDARDMNIITGDGQGVYMIGSAAADGIIYGDYQSYAADGQLWLWGGRSNYGVNCGLVFANTSNAWTYQSANLSARLAYYGTLTHKDLRN